MGMEIVLAFADLDCIRVVSFSGSLSGLCAGATSSICIQTREKRAASASRRLGAKERVSNRLRNSEVGNFDAAVGRNNEFGLSLFCSVGSAVWRYDTGFGAH